MRIETAASRHRPVAGVLLAGTVTFLWMELSVGLVRGDGDVVTRLSLALLPFVILGAIVASVMAVAAYREHGAHAAAYRSGVAVALVASFILLWVMPAVGILGRDGDPADLVYFVALAVGVGGAALSRFRPAGMARAALATALALALIGVGVATMASPGSPPGVLLKILAFNGSFAALFGGAAALFRIAARG